MANTPQAQQVTVTSPTQLRTASEPYAQALARDIETLTYQLNQLSRQVAELKAQLAP
jgi:polyhydroxyalkanoate synthesis regulator phasin